jgi:hypothetical protein
MLFNVRTTQYNIPGEYPTEFHSKIEQYHSHIWKQLTTTLHSTGARRNIFSFLENLDQLHSAIIKKPLLATPSKFLLPTNKAFPSISEQVVSDPTAILDPYELSLRRNYYFPISSFNTPDTMEAGDNSTINTNNHTSTSPPSSPMKKKIVTAEDSIETITELLAEMEEEELPVQSQPSTPAFQPSSQVQPSYFNHRLAIYRKSSTPYVANAPSQLLLFKSFLQKS